MALKFFTITVRDAAQGEQELNAFLSSHRVIAVDRRFIDQGENSFWSICVDYMTGTNGKVATYGDRKGRVDYREVLSPKDFAIFAKLRTLRKQLAQAEAVPVYMIFTNEQLAEMVRRRAASNADLEAIASVHDDHQVMITTTRGMLVRIRVSEIRVIGRNTQGVRLIRLEEGDTVASLAKIAAEES